MRNNPDDVAIQDVGPLPPGKYYIVTRPGNGFKHLVKDAAYSLFSGSNHFTWFALYREDSNIDDHTFIDNVERGNFRLHPAGYKGVSNGCITFVSKDGFNIFREALLRTPTFKVSGQLEAYGTVQVY